MNHYKNIFPFTAIIGQDNLKTALILAAVNPKIGGVLVRGEKGTAKSTAVRALSAVLPKMKRHAGCSFACDPERPEEGCAFCRSATSHDLIQQTIPVVILPLSATEDRVAGGMDFNLAVKSGCRVLAPGLLASAHRGILYVDEVNLLDDHIVDIILDAASSGENRIEREGMAFVHSSRFILVGTMNPEEGELRPQLLDRFGLCVDVRSEEDRDMRVNLMQLRDEFDQNPGSFMVKYSLKNRELAERIVSACSLLPDVVFPDYLKTLVVNLTTENNVAGHRADLTIEQAAKALAAFEGRSSVEVSDVKRVAEFALIHRRRDASPPPQDHDHQHDHPKDQNEKNGEDQNQEQDQSQEQDNTSDSEEPQNAKNPHEPEDDGSESDEPEENDGSENSRQAERQSVKDTIAEVGETFKVKKFSSTKDRIFRKGSGRRSRSRTATKQGRYVKSADNKGRGDIAFDATLRAAAPYQIQRKITGDSHLAVVLTAQDIREKIREKRIGNFLLFVVDASGSMGARGRMAASKGAIMSLLLDAYQKRDKVALVSFRRDEAVVNLPPTSSIELAARMLKDMPVGGKTPLSSGLIKGFDLIRNHLIREPDARPMMILITDGRANVSMTGEKPLPEALSFALKIATEERLTTLVVDPENQGPVTFGLARKLAESLTATYFKIDDLKADRLIDIIKEKQMLTG
ncbi:MAG: putative cobaltochelatase [Desulfobacteraceae bacterium]|jgi:magnesium chelatase subunit D